jgi:hypothetical protein
MLQSSVHTSRFEGERDHHQMNARERGNARDYKGKRKKQLNDRIEPENIATWRGFCDGREECYLKHGFL